MRRLPPPLTLLALLSVSVASCSRGSPPAAGVPGVPVADFPESIALGIRERGEVATARFVVANRGGAELVMDEFRSNCSCSGIERKQGDEYVRVDVLRISPGEHVELQMRVSVRGVPVGAQARNGVTFRTNDPAKPEGRIESVIERVTGGISTVPETVVVGTVPVGSSVTHVFEVRDDAVIPRTLAQVSTSYPGVMARILDQKGSLPPAGGEHIGTCIARVEVTVDTTQTGSIDCVLTLHLNGAQQPPDQIRVLGTVVGPVVALPSMLLLPRSSPEGPVYTTKCVLRATGGKPLSVTVDSCPAHLKVTVPSADHPSPTVVVSISLDPSVVRKNRDKPVRLRCRAGDVETTVELRVIIEPTP